MRRNNFILLDDFIEKYNLNKNSFESMRARGYYPQNIFDKSGGRRNIKINENYFLKRKYQIKKIWSAACENYYILNENLSNYKLAKLLHEIDNSKSINSWTMFLHSDLFTRPSEKITKVSLTKGIYKFVRYSNWIIRRDTTMHTGI